MAYLGILFPVQGRQSKLQHIRGPCNGLREIQNCLFESPLRIDETFLISPRSTWAYMRMRFIKHIGSIFQDHLVHPRVNLNSAEETNSRPTYYLGYHEDVSDLFNYDQGSFKNIQSNLRSFNSHICVTETFWAPSQLIESRRKSIEGSQSLRERHLDWVHNLL